jgi:hypothetical protein
MVMVDEGRSRWIFDASVLARDNRGWTYLGKYMA